MVIDKQLRKVGGSITCAVPQEIVRSFNLKRGDTIRWRVSEDKVTVQFFKVQELRL